LGSCEGLEWLLGLARLRGGEWLCGDVEEIRGWLARLSEYRGLAGGVEPLYTPRGEGRVGGEEGYPRVRPWEPLPVRRRDGFVEFPWGGRG